MSAARAGSIIFIAKRVASSDIPETDKRGDIARVTRFDVFAFVCLNQHEAADAFAFACARIINRVAFAERAGINAEENKFADERIAPKLERQRTEFAVVIGWRFHRLTVSGSMPFAGGMSSGHGR